MGAEARCSKPSISKLGSEDFCPAMKINAGVLRTEVHPTAGRVTVVGDMDAGRLIKKLAKVGKIAEVIQPPPEAEKTRHGGKPAKHGAAADNEDKRCGGRNGDGVKAAVGFHRAEAPAAMAVPVLQLPCYASSCTYDAGAADDDDDGGRDVRVWWLLLRDSSPIAGVGVSQ
uniref:HMA domain-containing protein n=1 Tax=Leersia perrieri TaxID=77586 RepID=A0A0D9X5D8_9ORYZ